MLEAVSPSGSPEADALAALERFDHHLALEIMMNAYGDALHRYCRRMVGEPLAEDIHQMSFVYAYESFEGFRGQSSLRAWLYGIARHRCLDALRKEKRRGPSTDDVPDITAPGPQLDHRLAERQVLEDCLGRLKPKIREAVILRYIEGLSFAEMSAACEEDSGALERRVARALPLLRKCIEAKSR